MMNDPRTNATNISGHTDHPGGIVPAFARRAATFANNAAGVVETVAQGVHMLGADGKHIYETTRKELNVHGGYHNGKPLVTGGLFW